MTKITAAPFGVTKNGTEVSLYTLANGKGAEVDICTYGGAIVAIRVPGRDGKLVDVALGYAGGFPRKPVLPAAPQLEQEMRQALEAAGHPVH